ncbi:MAG: GTP diphosphokinase, partial [Gammaproteobacteria bacterium]|nr:GTP diphosphokinase [Gammaproteobacteria bacterium]
MQKTKPQLGITQRYSLDEFVRMISRKEPDAESRLYKACQIAWSVQDIQMEKPSGLEVALILHELGVDETTYVVTFLSDPRLRDTPAMVNLEKDFGKNIKHMVDNVLWLNDFQLKPEQHSGPEQAERLRRMLLAMVEDVRVVLIKLAYRVQRLRMLSRSDTEQRRYIAQETLEIFAPLANRMGIGQLKWELEDLSFRYLEPMTYKRVAKMLEERRDLREQFIVDVVDDIREMLTDAGIKAEVYGRPKHIYSIWKKMASKQKDFTELFDVRAVRITVESVGDCYTVLGLVHGKWRHIAHEFDDYIANPKENGYRSLHTAVFGPQGKPLEIQIRTKEMHEFAEYGVAAHWRYKEGSQADNSLERGVASLRKLLDPNETEDDELIDSFHTELFPDRVFVLTPTGKVMDLPQGSTPLDFAYAVHTEIGHRCRGAKVNGHIVQLTYELHNGEQVEVLTTNRSEPSRDWMNPNLAYLKTSRARAKVRSWFKHQDYHINLADGKAVFERELHRQGYNKFDTDKLIKHFKQPSMDDFYAAIGGGDITGGQIASALQGIHGPDHSEEIPLVAQQKLSHRKASTGDEVRVRGVGNLLTTISNCCKPLPGDPIIGFITRGQGVTIHRQDCSNVINLEDSKRDRLIEVDWGVELSRTYPVSIHVEAIDRQGLLRDVSKVLADDKVDVISVNTLSDKDNQTANMTITTEISDLQQLGRVMDKISQLPNVTK